MGIILLIFLMQITQYLCWDMERAAQGAAGWQERESGWHSLPPWLYTACDPVVLQKNFKGTVPQLEWSAASFPKTG